MQKVGVTSSEMMELRNQGYCNHDIARMLDISVSSVIRYIGKQPKGLGRLAAFADKPKGEAKVETPVEDIPKYAPLLLGETYKLAADLYAGIDHGSECIYINVADSPRGLSITYDQARELVQFLAWASDRCKPREGAASETE